MDSSHPSWLATGRCAEHYGGPAIDDRAAAPIRADAVSLRIANMDCASEESEIRRALEPFSTLHNLRFDLGRRTLTLDTPVVPLEQVLSAIRKAGFQPEVLGAQSLDQRQDQAPDSASGDRDNSEQHGSLHAGSGLGEGLPRLVLALAFHVRLLAATRSERTGAMAAISRRRISEARLGAFCSRLAATSSASRLRNSAAATSSWAARSANSCSSNWYCRDQSMVATASSAHWRQRSVTRRWNMTMNWSVAVSRQ
jgi:copper chaperone CopZ